MILFSKTKTNGKIEPWLQENEWVFEITFYACQFLIGWCFAGGIASASIGPFSFIYWRNNFKP